MNNTRDTDLITEAVRGSLTRTITRRFCEHGQLRVVTLDAEVEKQIVGSLTKNEQGVYLAMETGRKNAYKYADTGIRTTLREMEMKGACRAAINAKIAGGARMFEVSGGSLGNIGQRNSESVHQILRMEKIRLLWEDVGGTIARTMEFDSATGNGTIRSYGHPEVKF